MLQFAADFERRKKEAEELAAKKEEELQRRLNAVALTLELFLEEMELTEYTPHHYVRVYVLSGCVQLETITGR